MLRPGGQHIAAPRARGLPEGPGATRRPASAVNTHRQFLRATSALPEDMQPVAELAFLDVADKAINARDHLGGAGLRRDAQIGA